MPVIDKQDTIVASLCWNLVGGIVQAQGDAVQRLGYGHVFFMYNEPIPAEAHIVLVQGPYATLRPLVRQLLQRTPAERPVLAYWFQQSMNWIQPGWLRWYLAAMCCKLSQIEGAAGWPARQLMALDRRLMGPRGARLRYLGDILWLHRAGLLDVLALSSTLYADDLTRHGIPSLVVPRGYHPSYGALLGSPRDIAVVWMGKTRGKRRRQAVYYLQAELARRGQVMQVYDGEQNAFIFGDERTRILNRARFVVNIYPDPTWEISIRFYIAAANGAVVLTEPGQNHYPFAPGQHLVECTIEEMPDRVMYYLAHEDERQKMADTMLGFVQSEASLEQSVTRILGAAEHAMRARPGQGHAVSAWPQARHTSSDMRAK